MAARGAWAAARAGAAHRRALARSCGRCGISGPRRGVPAGAGAIRLDHRPQRADRHPLGHGQCRRNSQARGGIRLDCCNAATAGAPAAKTTSGASATNSATYLRSRSGSPKPHRYSIRRFRPSDQPRSCRPWTKALLRACHSGSPAGKEPTSTPMRRTRSPCCARAASGHAAAALPNSLMSSRLFTQSPRRRSRAAWARRPARARVQWSG